MLMNFSLTRVAPLVKHSLKSVHKFSSNPANRQTNMMEEKTWTVKQRQIQTQAFFLKTPTMKQAEPIAIMGAGGTAPYFFCEEHLILQDYADMGFGM